MKKLIKFVIIGALIVTGLNAKDLLDMATNGKVSDNSFGVKILNQDGMKSVLGGQYTYGYINESNGIAQVIMSLDNSYETYNGRKLWVVAQKYGKDLQSGFSVYLAYRDNNYPSLRNSRYGEVFNVIEIEKNRESYNILAPHIKIAKRMLDLVKPEYVG